MSKMTSLSEVMAKVEYLDSMHAISTYLTRAIETDLREEDIPTARRFLADLFERNDRPELAFDQYELLEDAENTERLGITKAEKSIRFAKTHYELRDATKLFLRFGGREVAIEALCSQVIFTPYLEDILMIVGGDEDENIATIMSFDKTPHDLRAQCQEKQGDYVAAAETLIPFKVSHRIYDNIIRLYTLAEEHEKAAEVCLEAQDDPKQYKEDKNYPRGAFRLFMEAGKSSRALGAFSRYWIKAPMWEKLEQDVHSAYVAQGHDEQEAWNHTVNALEEQKESWTDDLHDPLSIAYEKVGRFEEAGREVLKKIYYYDKCRAYAMFVKSGMSEKAAAEVVLERIKNEFPERYTDAFFHEKAGNLEKAASMYEAMGHIDSVIRCKQMLQS
jgi:hypothetical protein